MRIGFKYRVSKGKKMLSQIVKQTLFPYSKEFLAFFFSLKEVWFVGKQSVSHRISVLNNENICLLLNCQG